MGIKEMASCTIKDWQGAEIGSTDLDLAVAKPETATHLLYLALRRQLTNARQGNAHTKTRSEVRGGGRKPWRQKGTGRARAGSIRSPLWRKGGVIFGPRKREFHLDMNRKERQLALRTALQSRAADLIVVEDFAAQLVQPKTREVAQALLRWGVAEDQSALVIVAEKNDNVYRATRNIARVKLITVNNLNVFDLLNVDWIVVTQPALDLIKEGQGSRPATASAPAAVGAEPAPSGSANFQAEVSESEISQSEPSESAMTAELQASPAPPGKSDSKGSKPQATPASEGEEA
jgi:large subunit ribosomal protein L4